MSSSGPRNGTSITQTGIGNAWTPLSGMLTAGSSAATATTDTTGAQITDFGFSIPTDAVIAGIKVEVAFNLIDSGLANLIVTPRLSGSNHGSFDWQEINSTVEQYYTFGGPTSLANTTWTPANINSSTFGMQISSGIVGEAPPVAVSIDHVRVTVYYNLVPTVTNVNPTSGPAAGGTLVTLTGTNFVIGGTTVKFGGIAATGVSVSSSTSLTCTSPAGSGTVDITVTTPDGTSATSASDRFTYDSTVSVTNCSPNNGTRLGGTPVTITGTNFGGSPSVTFGGTAATSVVVVNGSTITCVTPAHVYGVVNIVVTIGANSGTLSNGYTYNPVTFTQSLAGSLGAMSGAIVTGRVQDSTIRLVKGGTVVGDNKSRISAWPSDAAYEEYGGAVDLWGTTWTPAEINASNFGFVLSALVERGTAQVDYADITVYYEIASQGDPTSMLQTIKVDPTRLIGTPQMWKLGRSGQLTANDPNVPKDTSDIEYHSSRYYQPSRIVKKIFERLELWLEVDPEGDNIPGVVIYASIDDGDWIQLLDEMGEECILKTTGHHVCYLPPTSESVGHYCKLKFVVPELGAGETDVAVTIRDRILWASQWSTTSKLIETTLVLTQGEFEDGTSMKDPVYEQKRQLEALAGPLTAPMAYSDTHGNEGYAKIMKIVSITEAKLNYFSEPVYLAHVILRVNPYG